MNKRVLVISDIHGQYEALLKALDYANYSSSDTLIFLGDYINRGKRSKDVLSLLCELKKNPDNIFLKGNHEEIILQLLQGNCEYWYMWLEYGEGRACIRSYGVNPELIYSKDTEYYYSDEHETYRLNKEGSRRFIQRLFPEEHLEFMRSTVATYQLGEFFFSHAGIEKGLDLAEQSLFTDYFLVWGDEEFLHDRAEYGKLVIYGHYHLDSPLIRNNKICIALRDAIAVLDLDTMIVIDSRGRKTELLKQLKIV